MSRLLLVLSLVAGCFAAPQIATAAETKVAIPTIILSDDDKADIARAEKYLHEMPTLSANFVQIADNGSTVTGTFKLQRPGKMRITYDPPSQDYIVADGDFVNMWDGEMKQSSSLPIDASLANVILRDDLKLSGDIMVTKVERSPSSLAITVAETGNADQGRLTLFFEDKPFLFRQWRVEDAAGRVTTVALQDLRSGIEFPSSTFAFQPPNLGKANKLQDPK